MTAEAACQAYPWVIQSLWVNPSQVQLLKKRRQNRPASKYSCSEVSAGTSKVVADNVPCGSRIPLVSHSQTGSPQWDPTCGRQESSALSNPAGLWDQRLREVSMAHCELHIGHLESHDAPSSHRGSPAICSLLSADDRTSRQCCHAPILTSLQRASTLRLQGCEVPQGHHLDRDRLAWPVLTSLMILNSDLNTGCYMHPVCFCCLPLKIKAHSDKDQQIHLTVWHLPSWMRAKTTLWHHVKPLCWAMSILTCVVGHTEGAPW